MNCSVERFSESSTDSEDGAAAKESVTAAGESGASLIETGVTQHLAPFAASTPSKVTPDDGIESTATGSASSSVLDSQIESTDGHETSVAQSDSETSSNSGGDVEEGWVTETSEMVTSFVTETVRTTKIDEFGHEVVEETVRVIGPDGREVDPGIANSLMRSPSFVRKY